jgi:hypothetical protein
MGRREVDLDHPPAVEAAGTLQVSREHDRLHRGGTEVHPDVQVRRRQVQPRDAAALVAAELIEGGDSPRPATLTNADEQGRRFERSCAVTSAVSAVIRIDRSKTRTVMSLL